MKLEIDVAEFAQLKAGKSIGGAAINTSN